MVTIIHTFSDVTTSVLLVHLHGRLVPAFGWWVACLRWSCECCQKGQHDRQRSSTTVSDYVLLSLIYTVLVPRQKSPLAIVPRQGCTVITASRGRKAQATAVLNTVYFFSLNLHVEGKTLQIALWYTYQRIASSTGILPVFNL
jgi:hypothetical protein